MSAREGRTFGVTLSLEQAQALHWLARHLCFEDAMQSTPPHLGKEVRTERAYQIVHAVAALQTAIEEAGQHGDAWMYSQGSSLPGNDKPEHWFPANRNGFNDGNDS